MKRFCLLLIAACILALGCSEADTLFPGDEAYYNPSTPEGTSITTLTATVGNISEENPYINISFDTQIDDTTVVFDTSVIVEYPAGVTTLVEGTGYDGIVNSSHITLDLSPSAPLSGTTVRVILTAANKALADSSVSLTPVNVTRVLP